MAAKSTASSLKGVRVEATCSVCGRAFTSTSFTVGGREIVCRICDPCSDAMEERGQESVPSAQVDYKARRRSRWGEMVLPKYAMVYKNKLPAAAKKVYDKVMARDYGPRGLILLGPSDQGKSMLAHDLVKKWFVQGHSATVYSAKGLSWHIGSQEQSERRQAVESCLRADVLLLDDLGKEKLTNTVESDFYHIVEQREGRGLPVVMTANGGREEILKRFSEDGGEPFLNRLRRTCDVIGLTG